jgi:hypothetical protein
MNLAAVEQIARAVLYEGYMLYPYRPSSVKNQQRWNFGVLFPQSYSEFQQGSDACMSQTQCLVRGSLFPAIEVRVRFLHLVTRSIGQLARPVQQLPADDALDFETVASLEVDGQVFRPWQEVEEREISLRLQYGDSVPARQQQEFTFPAGRRLEPLRDPAGHVAGVIVRDTQSLCAVVETSATRCREDVFKITIRICNRTPFDFPEQKSRDEALQYSLISAHTALGANNCEFVSLLDPPPDMQDLAASCHNIGAWPVLVGEAGQRDTVLASPIILYDYPQIAPESAGDLFDGTEIDEILSLRIMTLTDDEKREMRESDARARQILERTETLPPEQLMKLHGVVRSVRPIKEEAS